MMYIVYRITSLSIAIGKVNSEKVCARAGNVANSKCHVPALHPGNQQSCLQEILLCNTPAKLHAIRCD